MAQMISARRKARRKAVTGTTDLFTTIELDPWCKALEASFDASECITWYLNSVQYEADRGIWHYEWRWTVTGCG